MDGEEGRIFADGESLRSLCNAMDCDQLRRRNGGLRVRGELIDSQVLSVVACLAIGETVHACNRETVCVNGVFERL